MALESPLRQLLEEIKYGRKFPPRDASARKKSELALQGLAHSGAIIEEVSKLYIVAAEGVLDEFTETVTAKAAALGVRSADELRRVVATAHQQVFDETRSLVLGELPGQADDYRTLAMGIVDGRRGQVWEHLERQLALRKLDGPAPTAKEKEREQKFGILLSAGQAGRDFEDWVADAKKWDNPIAFLFVDLDRFKALNERWTNATVDETILPAVQRLLAKLVQGRGEAYRHGGEEFLLIMPNMDLVEAQAFAEKVRGTFEQYCFEVKGVTEPMTVSVGVAVWPDHGGTYQEVLRAANRAELGAKQTRNAVRVVDRLPPSG